MVEMQSCTVPLRSSAVLATETISLKDSEAKLGRDARSQGSPRLNGCGRRPQLPITRPAMDCCPHCPALRLGQNPGSDGELYEVRRVVVGHAYIPLKRRNPHT